MKKHMLLRSLGFTGVEILITITVIGILVTMVTVGYLAYVQNANQAQITTTIHAYQGSLKGIAFEADSYPSSSFCVPKDSKCCSTTSAEPTTVYCGNDTDLGWPANSSPAGWVERYVEDPPPRMPNFANFIDCTASGMMSNGPCKETSTTKTGLLYIRNTTGALYTSTAAAKGFLVYYIDPAYDCGSSDVMTFAAGNLTFTSAKYSRETSSYRECIIGLRGS